MDKLSKYRWIILSVSLIFTLILLSIWLIPSQNIAQQPQKTQANLASSTATIASSNLISDTLATSTQSISQQDTEINCQLSINQTKNLIIDEKTKNCFEYFISQYGEKNLDQLKNDFSRYIQMTYQEPATSQIIDLWERYLKYRQQLAHLEKPDLPSETSAYYRKIFNDMLQLKQQFFSTYEIEGLFSHDALYDQYTLDRMDIYANDALNELEKAKQLRQLLDNLPQDWQENLKQLNQLEDLRQLTSELKNKGGTVAQIREMRSNLVGVDAAERLEQLDQQRQQWKIRVNDYLDERDTILKSTMSNIAKQQAIQHLKNQNFSSSEEQLRIETFEHLYDQGQPLPLPD